MSQVPVSSDLDPSIDQSKNDRFTGDRSAMDSSATRDSPVVSDDRSFSHLVADPGQVSQQEQYATSQGQPNVWDADQVPQMHQDQGQPSPALFGGTDSLVAESQGWWFRDHSFFENWYSLDQAALMFSNDITHDASIMNNNMHTYGLHASVSGPDRPTY